MRMFVDSAEDNDTYDDNNGDFIVEQYANLIDQLQMNSLSCGCNYTDNDWIMEGCDDDNQSTVALNVVGLWD